MSQYVKPDAWMLIKVGGEPITVALVPNQTQTNTQAWVPLFRTPPRRELSDPVAIKTANGITLKAGWDALPDGTELYAMEASK
jgi:hypothetical protein